MPEEFDIQKLKEQYPEFFKQVSPNLLEFILSKETSSKISEICLENGIEDEEKIEKIAYRVTLALLDQVPKENLAEIFEKGAKIDSETARKISIEIKRLIFSQIPKTKPQKTQPIKPPPATFEEEKLEETEKTEKIEKPSKKDFYREPIE